MKFKTSSGKENNLRSTSASTDGCKVVANLPGFVLGVQDMFTLKESDDLFVVGKVDGTVRVGAEVCLFNFGDDEAKVFHSSVLDIEIQGPQRVNAATDCYASLLIEAGKKLNLKCGSVIYTENTEPEDIHNAYVFAIDDSIMEKDELVFDPKEINVLSITDCQQILSLYKLKIAEVEEPAESHDDEALNLIREKEYYLANILAEKLLSAKSIYCVYSSITDEPYLFSETIARQDGDYFCSAPEIMLITEAYRCIVLEQYLSDKFEIRKISNGDDNQGIANFLCSAFYLNGACGVTVNDEQASLPAEALITSPDFSDIDEADQPVMNPDLERWLLLIAQLGYPDTPDKEIIHGLYFDFMRRELNKARFLVPIKQEGNDQSDSEPDKTVFNKGNNFSLATVDGKYDRTALRLYTDWKRLYEGMGNDWEAVVQTIYEVIEIFDCAINLTDKDAGCYVSRELFDSIR